MIGLGAMIRATDIDVTYDLKLRHIVFAAYDLFQRHSECIQLIPIRDNLFCACIVH